MTNIATKLENDPELRDRTVTVVMWLMGIGATMSMVGLAILAHQIL
ncbi:hypothetical protein IP92_00449 [Pseudoduganella flava]|uniref:DUF2474 family protein n=1 Tax=Pseudoduganella flava TaxID=871742 RepID=A0A562Q413_9BURK|nr:hypothetical protein [Pseudoduganella flava]QGZ41499.1 hypothetical protein GO485_22185 [Pseudoduganella flava]TWI51464.1 hypothetical protein IP92_00449 [Pseudoduganella flava]